MAAYYEPGRYYVQVVNQGFGQSKEKKTTYFYLTIKPVERIVSPDDREICVQQFERTIFNYITEKTVDRLVEQLRELGWDGTNWGELDPSSPDAHSFVGQEILAQCDQEIYEGNYKEKWQLPGRGGLDHEAEPDTTRKLNAMFGKALKGSRPSKPAPPTKRETVPPEDRQGDEREIPF